MIAAGSSRPGGLRGNLGWFDTVDDTDIVRLSRPCGGSGEELERPRVRFGVPERVNQDIHDNYLKNLK